MLDRRAAPYGGPPGGKELPGQDLSLLDLYLMPPRQHF